MSFLNSMNISASALTATRLRMDVVLENMANSNTTRTETGDPYRRKYVVYQERVDKVKDKAFEACFNSARIQPGWTKHAPGGVRVLEVGTDMSEFKLDYNPSHPDANEDGYVRLPNVEVVQEMVDMMSAYRAYEANITALNAFKDMAVKTMEIGK